MIKFFFGDISLLITFLWNHILLWMFYSIQNIDRSLDQWKYSGNCTFFKWIPDLYSRNMRPDLMWMSSSKVPKLHYYLMKRAIIPELHSGDLEIWTAAGDLEMAKWTERVKAYPLLLPFLPSIFLLSSQASSFFQSSNTDYKDS